MRIKSKEVSATFRENTLTVFFLVLGMVRSAGALAICGIISKEVSARFRGMVESRGYTFEKGTERGSDFRWRTRLC